jgi:hypothetical protein
MTDFSKAIQLISIWGIMVPLAIGLFNYKTAGYQFRLFIFFLVIGFATDITMYVLKGTIYKDRLPDIFNYYSLVEAITFLLVIYLNATGKLMKQSVSILILITMLLWLVVVLIRPVFLQVPASQIFDPFYEVIVAFLAGFTLLQLVEEQPDVIHIPVFWILLGIFFYCFCTFFLMGFVNTLLSQRIWIVNNIINLLTYVLYSVGLWKLRHPISATFSR